jgi:hypothetical protein
MIKWVSVMGAAKMVSGIMRDNMSVYELRDIDFERISRLVYEQCGINLHDGKKELVKARLSKRLREGNFTSFGDYYRYVVSDEGTDELISMIDSLSTNLTFFFREDSHFRKLSEILPAMLSGGEAGWLLCQTENLECRLLNRGRTVFHRHDRLRVR